MESSSQADSEPTWQWATEHRFPSQVGAHLNLIDQVLEEMRRQGWADNDVFSVHLALEEALVNAMKHGNGFDEEKQVSFACKIASTRLWVSVADEGSGFVAEDVPDPTADDRLEIPSGRGIMLMRSFMSRVEYNDQGNHLVMEKHASPAPEETSDEPASGESKG